MLSTLGQALVLVALACCAFGAPLGFAAGLRRSPRGLVWMRRLALVFGAALTLATMVMWYALLSHDFSVSYVAQVGSRATPPDITIYSLWSSLEGSILFWGFVLGLFTAALAVLQRRGHEDYLAYTLAVVFCVGGFFTYMIAGPANPFAPTPPPIPSDGPGPNNLLQNHFLMAVHPPTLYIGFVGMTIPFAMAMAALLRGQLGPTWLRPMRNWLLLPTAFLTLAIMLGGWWAYEVLGWGGYWAWDPVENASFLPWLTAIAAVHSAIVQQRRGSLKAWTVILILVTFLLTILGTFLTRSGVINSVHSFTQSPIGPMFLVFLVIASVAVVLTLAFRVDALASEPSGQGALSREGAFLVNNLLLVAVTFTVLVGTLYPILAEFVRDRKVSVGAPWFNQFSIPMFLGLLLLIGIGPALPWGRADPRAVKRALLAPIPAAGASALVAALLGARSFPVLFTAALAGFATWVTVDQMTRPGRARRKRGEGAAQAFSNASRLAPRRLGAYLVHLGFIVTVVAVCISSSYRTEREATLSAGQAMEVGNYRLTFMDTAIDRQPHVSKQKARVLVERDGKVLGQLRPSLNFYPNQRDPLGTPAVHGSATHDLYLTLMNVGRDGTVGIRAFLTPAVVWVWIGVIMMFLATLLCLVPAARALEVKSSRPVPAGGTAPAGS